MPYAVQVEFRTASSFLVAYSVNLSRGGLFIETEVDIPTGSMMTIDFAVPGAGTTSISLDSTLPATLASAACVISAVLMIDLMLRASVVRSWRSPDSSRICTP